MQHDEIERKFIVINDQWKQHINASATEDIVQGYIDSPDATVRVRISTNVESGQSKAVIEIKSKREIKKGAIKRQEWGGYEIPVDDAQGLLANEVCKSQIEKRRFHVERGGRDWTVDEFTPKSKFHGLKLAEIEFEKPGEHIDLPAFVSKDSEVTKDGRFTSRYLAKPQDGLHFLKKAIADAKHHSHHK